MENIHKKGMGVCACNIYVCVCVCGEGGGWGVNYSTTAGGRGLASGLPSLERPGRPKTFSRLWSPICNGKLAYNGRQKGNANEAVRGLERRKRCTVSASAGRG